MSPDADDLSFTYDWQMADYARVSGYLTREAYSGKWRIMIWVVGILVALAAVIEIGEIISNGLPELISNLPWVLLIAGWFALVRGHLSWIQAWFVKRRDPNVGHPIIVSLTESGIKVETRTQNLELKWTGMLKVRDRPDCFMFYYSSYLAYYLPKRAVASDAMLARVRDHIQRHLPPATPFITG